MKDPVSIPDIAHSLLTSSHEGVSSLTAQLSKELSLPVLVTNQHFQLIASASLPDGTNTDSILAIEQMDMYEHSSMSKCRITMTETFFHCCRVPIIHKADTVGYLLLVDEHERLNPESCQSLLEYTASLLAIQLHKKIELRQEKMNFKKPFLFDLLYGNIKDRQEIIEYGKVWGWDFTIPQTAIVFSLVDFTHVSSDKKLAEKLLYIVEKTLLGHNMKPVTMLKQNQVTAIVATEHETAEQTTSLLEALAASVIKQMHSLHADRTSACGLGKTYHNPTDLFRSFQEAKVALEIGQLLKIPIPFFTDLGLERILYKHDLQELKEFYQSSLGDLILYDENHHTDLAETLESFAANQFEMTATANALFLHRNTLRYRLKKTEEILGLKLDDWNNRLKIVAAFKIKQLRKI
ncbi:PucR family transcriptional regulator [Bacillus marinisedimentorum]|uniref:PucR family transcriptional regulator n=1 Tax=Bacillus marinisedimentorum TaxID=1821260 RepID=UPI000872A52F|nr:helix-turn-helix domain-containing protein [Bacillus marinisedimentorum]